MEKLASVVPTKVWEAHRKNLTALAQAKEAAAGSKQAVVAAFAKSLKLPDPDIRRRGKGRCGAATKREADAPRDRLA
jgi:hypothetical protein